jgi:hypothetical protein
MRALSTVLLGLVVVAPVALAQKAHEYDPAAEVTITGVVVDYHESKKKDDHPGLHFILEVPVAPAEAASEAEPAAPAADLAPEPTAPATAAEPPSAPAPAETVEVHACPVKLLSQLDFPIEKGDEITVTGSRSEDVVIARVVKKGSAELQLRDEEGVPIWTGLP